MRAEQHVHLEDAAHQVGPGDVRLAAGSGPRCLRLRGSVLQMPTALLGRGRERIQNGYTERGAKFGGIKTLKEGIDSGTLDLKTARDIRNNLLKVWEDTAKRLGTWKK